MTFFLSSYCHTHISFFARSLIFLSFSQRLIQYNMTHSKAYIPLHALRKIDIQSILGVAFPLLNDDETQRRYDYHHSRRTMLYFLLSMYNVPNNEQTIRLINECSSKIDYSNIEKNYNDLKNIIEPYQKQYGAENLGTYWELKKEVNRPGPMQSRNYISKYRQDGFQKDELKLYWNYDQIRDLNKNDRFNPVTDSDTYNALLKSPVDKRKNSGTIQFIQTGIENAVFQVPEDKQVIVLDFADERMPGGYFLENARTQEEVILYNSDGYHAILDLKYQIMDGGYMVPEYGVAYIKRVRFFQEISEKERITDLIVAACYDLSGMGEGLYKPPSHEKIDDLRARTYQKFQAIIASAVANTEGNGKDTYLLLGPIGTGAFSNDMKMIAELFSTILNEPLMDSGKPIRYAFDQIWFVSIDNLDVFVTEFNNEI
ncbi:unnamed protein product [Rotaria sordida]|uniref:Microbial-type PARG catalytic domain-containing protein n=2 Tax=Rotaria sordida TaxID=392033 RepID=A0A814YHL4_9BILA|nr:unnamed protein product [Rotaria sordida]